MRVRLTRKLAEALNGLDLRAVNVGEVVDVTDPLARMLIAERWAEELVNISTPSTADDRPRRKSRREVPTRGRKQPAKPVLPKARP